LHGKWFSRNHFFVFLPLEKLVNKKHFSLRKIWLDFQESVFLLFWTENTFQKLWKFRNIILFADYIKFGPQTFDWYIFCLNFFFISPLKFWFNLIFILTLVLIFMIVICFSLIIFLIEIFYLSNLVLILLIVTYFI